MLRRTFLTLATGVAAFSLGLGGVSAQELPKLKQKDKYKVGFAQTESNNPWRIAQTESMKAEAIEAGEVLISSERALDRAFAAGKMKPDMLASRTGRIGEAQGRLRAVHLKYHLTSAELLSDHQRQRYADLRGYR